MLKLRVAPALLSVGNVTRLAGASFECFRARDLCRLGFGDICFSCDVMAGVRTGSASILVTFASCLIVEGDSDVIGIGPGVVEISRDEPKSEMNEATDVSDMGLRDVRGVDFTDFTDADGESDDVMQVISGQSLMGLDMKAWSGESLKVEILGRPVGRVTGAQHNGDKLLMTSLLLVVTSLHENSSGRSRFLSSESCV